MYWYFCICEVNSRIECISFAINWKSVILNKNSYHMKIGLPQHQWYFGNLSVCFSKVTCHCWFLIPVLLCLFFSIAFIEIKFLNLAKFYADVDNCFTGKHFMWIIKIYWKNPYISKLPSLVFMLIYFILISWRVFAPF